MNRFNVSQYQTWMKSSVVFLGLVLGLPAVQFAADVEENYAYSKVAMTEILIGTGTRATAMGGAAVAVVDDLEALYWNPAGLGGMNSARFSFYHNSWFQDINRETVLFGVPFTKDLTVALGGHYMGLGSYEKTGITSDGRMVYNQETVNMSMYGGALGAGMTVLNGLRLGTAVHFASQDLGESSPMTVYGDLGAQYDGLGKTVLGIQVKNIGMSVDGYSIPMGTQIGGMYRIDTGKPGIVLLALDAELLFHEFADSIVHFGAEYIYARILKIRAGYEFSCAAKADGLWGLTAGIGLDLGAWRFGYSFAPQGELGIAHRLSLTLDMRELGKSDSQKRKKKKTQEKPMDLPRMGFNIDGGSVNTKRMPEMPTSSGSGALSKEEAAMRSFLQGNLTVEPRVTKAKRDGTREVHFLVKRNSGARVVKWTLTLRDDRGKTIRTLSGKDLPKMIRWDGMDQKGKEWADIKGVRFELTIEDINGQTEEQDGRVGGSQTKKSRADFDAKAFPPVLFETNQAEVTTKAARQIAVAADFIHANPNSKVYVEGYADSVNEGGKKVYLSKARAESVARYLTAYHKIPISRILVRGRGDANPVANNLDPDQRYKNRRVVITVKGQGK